MTFASTFGRVFSPTFQPYSQKAADTSWWLAGGIAASNCLVAYQPKGAADYTASKVNLANPGTYNAVDGNAPAFDTTKGWVFDGSNDYLKTGVVPSSVDWSYIFRYSDPDATNYRRWWGVRDSSTGVSVGMENRVGNNGFYVMNGSTSTNQKTVTSSGWYAICGNTFYEPNGTTATITTGTLPAYQIYIGAACHSGGLLSPKAITFITFAIYDIVLSSAQVVAISTAMAAL